MLHGQLLVVVWLQLLGELLIVGDFVWTDKEAGFILALLKGEHIVEDRIFRSLLLYPIFFKVLLLDQGVTECLRHLDFSLPSIIFVVLSSLLI
jgi:hypothetical protein